MKLGIFGRYSRKNEGRSTVAAQVRVNPVIELQSQVARLHSAIS